MPTPIDDTELERIVTDAIADGIAMTTVIYRLRGQHRRIDPARMKRTWDRILNGTTEDPQPAAPFSFRSDITYEEVWDRIVKYANKLFHTKTGLPFRYKVKNNAISISRTNQEISSTDIRKALELCPLPTSTAIHHLRGPSYLYAIMMDKRIREHDW